MDSEVLFQEIKKPEMPPLADRAKRLGIDPEGKNDQAIMGAIVEFRKNDKSYYSACEYLTGLRPDDPRLFDKIADDQKIIWSKYGLPTRGEMKANPSEAEVRLMEIAKRNQIRVRDKSDAGDYFDENIFAAVSFRNRGNGANIAVGINRNGERIDYIEGIKELMHEIVHGLQKIKYLNMPSEVREYEAYLSGISIDQLKALDVDNRAFILFGFLEMSVRNQAEGEGLPWDNPEWFLENIDGIKMVKEEKGGV